MAYTVHKRPDHKGGKTRPGMTVFLLCVWTASELRSKTPLVDVRAVRHPAVAGTNVAMFVDGIGVFALFAVQGRGRG